MPSITDPRLFLDSPAEGSWNMGVDQALLQSAEQGVASLRFYRWRPATLSLGYFQKQADRELHASSLTCPIVRRGSGGGAIIHDHELTYSLCLPATNAWAQKSGGKRASGKRLWNVGGWSSLYDLVHQSIKSALKSQGIDVELYSEGSSSNPDVQTNPKAFLCFQRRAIGDIICQGHKVGGSAQRRLKSGLIQHGSLLLKQSEFAPELPGLKEISNIEVDDQKLISELAASFESELECEFTESKLTETEILAAKEAVSKTFASEHWLSRR